MNVNEQSPKLPIYLLRMQVSGCNFRILVNDFLVAQGRNGNPFYNDIKINHLIWNLPVQLRVELSPMPGAEALSSDTGCKLWVLRQDGIGMRLPRADIFALSTPQFAPDEHTPAPPSFVLDGSFTPVVPFKAPRFLTANVFEIKPELVNRLITAYTTLYAAFVAKDVRKLQQLCSAREEDLAQCYYLPVTEQWEDTETSIKEDFSNPELELYKLNIDIAVPKLYAFGRLITLETELKGQSPICYVNWDAGATTYYPFYFCQANDGELIIIR